MSWRIYCAYLSTYEKWKFHTHLHGCYFISLSPFCLWTLISHDRYVGINGFSLLNVLHLLSSYGTEYANTSGIFSFFFLFWPYVLLVPEALVPQWLWKSEISFFYWHLNQCAKKLHIERYWINLVTCNSSLSCELGASHSTKTSKRRQRKWLKLQQTTTTTTTQ